MPDYMDIIAGYLEEVPPSSDEQGPSGAAGVRAERPAPGAHARAGFCGDAVPRQACPDCGKPTWQLLVTARSGGAWRWACVGCHPELDPRAGGAVPERGGG